MADPLNLSSEFSSLVKELHQKPDNPGLKQEVVSRIPKMMALAKENPMDLFRLAQVYSPTSPQYKHMMRQSAARGCTNAMLSMSELLLKSGSSADVKTAAHYMTMIERSNDSYIIQNSKKLLSDYPELAAEMRVHAKSEPYNGKIRFFANQPEKTAEKQLENQNSLVI